MPTHNESRILPYTAQQMFDLVADIKSYPEFLPWCNKARIIRHERSSEQGDEPDMMIAELVIGYKLIRERYTSRVILDHKNKTIQVSYISGPLKALRNEWRFTPDKKKSCKVDFFVQFEFSNPFLTGLMNMFFDVAFRQMVSAFEKRAADIYGGQ